MTQFKVWLLGLIILICLGCASSIKESPTEPLFHHTPTREMDTLHQSIGSSTVALVKLTITGELYPYCTGVWVRDGEILTAGHCVKHNPENENEDPTGNDINYTIKDNIKTDSLNKSITYYHGNVKLFNNRDDLALIQVRSTVPRHSIAQLANELPSIGEEVYGVGNPNGLYWIYVQGRISSYLYHGSLGKVIQANIAIYFGNSGGGLFDRDGRLIGICSKLLAIPSVGDYVHLDTIKDFLEYSKD